MVYYNPHITGQYNPLYNPTNQGPFFRGSPIFTRFFSLVLYESSGSYNQTTSQHWEGEISPVKTSGSRGPTKIIKNDVGFFIPSNLFFSTWKVDIYINGIL